MRPTDHVAARCWPWWRPRVRLGAHPPGFRAWLEEAAGLLCDGCFASRRSARRMSGRLRGRPTTPATAGILSSNGSNWVTSLRFPPGSDTASGIPWPSVMMWCLLPGRARSTGLGPLLGPCVRPGRGRSRSTPGTSPAGSSTAACSAAIGAAGPRCLPRSRLPGGASRSCPSRSRAPGGGTPTGCRCAGRTGCAQGLPVGHSRPSLDLLRRRLGQQRLDERPRSSDTIHGRD